MQTIATLGTSVRLIVFQFHVKNASVPKGIPKYLESHKPTARQFEGAGVRIMEPVPDVLSDFIAKSDYQLIDAWQVTEEEDWTRSAVRFVFCRKEYVNEKLRPEFVAQKESLLESFNRLAGKNLWQTMVHVNPFFSHQKRTKKTVLMLDCNSRKPTVKTEVSTGEEVQITVFQGGREKLGRGVFNPGIGLKILLTDKANRLNLVGNDIVLISPTSVQAPTPTLVG